MRIALYPKYLIRSLFVHGKQVFFKEGYKCLYPECVRNGMTPWQHYVIDGNRKGYDNGNHPPADVFFREGYEAEYPDVASMHEDAWRHYAATGKAEGRDNGLHPCDDLFYAKGYMEMYPDVAKRGVGAWQHYAVTGKAEGRDNGLHPAENHFYAKGYLEMYPDIVKSGLDPWHHYIERGKAEGRDNGLHPGKNQFYAKGYLEMYPDVVKSGLDPWHHYIERGKAEGRDNGLHPNEDQFYAKGYMEMYPDVAQNSLDPWHHYLKYGKSEGRDNGLHPDDSKFFAKGYLEMYPDAARSSLDPWHHYLEYGKSEGYDNGLHPDEAFFSRKIYLQLNPDVADAKLDPWKHYVQYGKNEGRRHGSSIKVTWPEARHLYSRNVLLIAVLGLPQCKLYRVDQKVAALEKQGYKVFVSEWTDKDKSISLMQFCSTVIFYRVPDFKMVLDCYTEAKRLGVHTVYDVDDLIFDEDIYREAVQKLDLPENVKTHLISDCKMYRNAMLLADENWFSTRTLCEVADENYGTKSICIPNSIPEELSEVAAEFSSERKENDTVKIFYGAASPHDRDVELVQEALEQILSKNKNVELFLIGEINFEFKNQDLRRRIFKVDRLGLKDYYYLISQCDIAVMPLESSLFNSAKSNIKYIEASMFSVPSVCSDLYEFSSVVRNGENGFIARNKDEWISSLQTLIDSRNKRMAIGKAARKTVLDRYSLSMLGRQMSALLDPYAVSKSSRETILVVNVLYGISSFGGATVVAERLAEEIRANSDYDVCVFSTYTDHNDEYGTLRRYSWNGLNVWAVNILGINVTYMDDGIRSVFAKVMDIVDPCMVHFHCIQTLGLGMCLECIERKVPYFVSIHDGFWSCSRQFMIDSRGRFCGDRIASCTMCRNRCGIANKDYFNRRHLSQYVLDNASKVYVPSQYFSELMQRNIPSVRFYINKNGIIQDKKGENSRTECPEKENGKIVLGFFGGKDHVKGYFFVKKCLESLGKDIENFKLILIDTTRKGGYEGNMKKDKWPLDTEIYGYTPHDKMHEMYRKIDVLLFPSMCKESFGLVVREAIYNDVFVICSDCGGPSEAIVNKENGLVFPQNDESSFKECLRFVIKNRNFIKSYRTTNFGDVRTFKDQALELLKDFDAVPARSCHIPEHSSER